jgi:carboxypeptidase D
LEVFSELKHKNFYLTGESYGLFFPCSDITFSHHFDLLAGYYVPYIANWIYDHPGIVPLNLKGVWITDGVLTSYLVQQYIVALPMVKKFPKVFDLNSTFMDQLQRRPLPTQSFNGTSDPQNILPQCLLWDDIFYAATATNPNFNVYRILDVWPVLWVRDFSIGFGSYLTQ